jgi:nuclear transport factor 2 (NTF2) superfamily protein
MALPISPPFTLDTAIAKVRAAEDAWNSRDPEAVSTTHSVSGVEQLPADSTERHGRSLPSPAVL